MKIQYCGLLATQAASQLLLRLPAGGDAGTGLAVNAHHQASLQPPLWNLQSSKSSGVELPPFKAGNYSIHEQGNSTCATKGERQWTGTIDVSDERRLFYWYFDSRSDPVNDPIVIWLNGGPGASSMRGLFTEIGPCMIEVGQNETTPNPHSWNNNASLLVMDQPAGVGFSDVKPGGTYAASDLEAARDLQEFLRLFFAKVLPGRAHIPIHFAGESYAGHYVPVTVKHILDSREWKSADAFWGNITSVILVNSIVHRLQSSIGHYELMCTDYRGKLWNDTVCERLASGLPTVEEMNSACEMSADGRTCGAMEELCMKLSLGILFEESQAGKRNRYNVKKRCFDTPGCQDDTRGNFTAYLNQPHILEAIGFPHDYRYDSSDDGAGSAIADSFDPYAPTVRQVAAILDASTKYSHRRGMADIRLLVLNGNEDGLVNTPGVKWLDERLPWSGAYGYRAQKWKQLEELGLSSEIATGEWKSTEDGRLLVFTVDEAGHMVPQDQPEAASWALRKWISKQI